MDIKNEDMRYRQLPAIGKIVQHKKSVKLIAEYGEGMFKLFLKEELAELRCRIAAGETVEYSEERLFNSLAMRLAALLRPLNRYILNTTGILLHTGLGRAPLAERAGDIVSAACSYTPVQSDVLTGKRTLREAKIEKMLRELTGAEAATVVNNNAAATMLMLNTIAAQRKVVISRGQLVEIGGAFRMPDVMKMSSAVMSEVGTTNRTHLHDYAEAIDGDTALLMHVHTSNYRLRGFGGTPDIAALAKLAHENSLLAVDDLGSGALTSLQRWGIDEEPLVRDSIAAGADLCCFSGDKLIGGPQAGIICGRNELITAIRKNPFARMFRVDKLTLAALEATLAIWINGNECEEIPLYRMLSTKKENLRLRAEKLYFALKNVFSGKVEMEKSLAYIGSGSLPDSGIESWAVVLEPEKLDAEEVAGLLRVHGVFSRVSNGRIWLDLIAVFDDDMDLLLSRTVGVLKDH